MILLSANPASVAVTIGAAVAYGLLATSARKFSPAVARSVLAVAWLLHAVTLGLELFGAEPRFGFAAALSVTVWLAVLVYAVESAVYPKLRTPWALSGLGAAVVLLELVFPGNLLGPKASFWLPLHWAFGIASYGMFGVAVAHGWLMSRAEASFRSGSDLQGGVPLLTLERLTYSFVMAGFVLLSATLGVVMLFAEQLYGTRTVWRWDHKTIFSLLSWLAFAVLLLGRWRFGWRGRTAARVLYAGAGLLLLSYVGSRFVMEIVLGRTS
jgi:ABC-type uncharacterized transport system permease subunit